MMQDSILQRVRWLLAFALGSFLVAQSCESSTGAAGGAEGTQCVDNASMVSVDISTGSGPPSAPWNGENAVLACVKVPPASTSTATDLSRALGVVSNGGLVLATGGEFRQAIALIRTFGYDSSHPFQISMNYRSYEVDAWRQWGDAVGTADDPFGPGWRASWGDMLVEPNYTGGPIVRVDEYGASWTHTQVTQETEPTGTTFAPQISRKYSGESGTRLLLEYHSIQGVATPIWFREWPDRTRVEYGTIPGGGGNLYTKRMYRGVYAFPDWQTAYTYNANGRLTKIVDARGIEHTFTWTTFGSTQQVTKLISTVPTNWSPTWGSIETNLEYSASAPYQLVRVRKPARAFLDDQDRSGAYETAESFIHEVVRFFTFVGGSNRIENVYDESTGLTRQMLALTYDPATPWRVATMTEGVTSSLPGQGPRTQTITYPQANRTVWTDARGVQRVYDFDTNFGSSPRQWRVTRIEEIASSGDPRPINDPNYHSSLVWQFAWACGCGQVTSVTMPSGLKHVIAYDGEGRGLVSSTGIIPAGGTVPEQVRQWSYRSWDDGDYRLASRLSGYVNALGKSGTNTFNFDANYGGYRVDGSFEGVELFRVQEDSTGRVVWIDEAAFQVDGGGTSRARVGYTFGSASSSPDCGLVTQVQTYAANGTTVYSTRTMSFEGLGWLRTITDELGRTATFNHDTIGQLTCAVLPTTPSGRGTSSYGGVFTFEYDRLGQIARSSQTAHDDQGAVYAHAAVVRTHVFDYFSRPWKDITDTTKLGDSGASSLSTVYEYDAGNRLVRVQASGGRETEYRIDDHNQLYQRREKLDGSNWSVEQHGYHQDGVLARVVEPTGLVGTVDTLDGWGRPQRIHLPGDKHVFLVRDAEDRTTQSEYRTGTGGATLQQTVAANFDDLGRVLQEVLSAPGLATTRTLTYTHNGPFRVSTAVDGDGRGLTYGYDALGRLVRKQDRLLGASGNAEVFTRDETGNVTRVEQVEQKQTGPSTYTTETYRIDLAYDNWDRLSRAEFWGSSGALQFTRYRGYDSLGNATWLKDGVGKETRRAYDAAGRTVDEWLHQRNPAATPVHLTLTYDDAPSDPLLSAILTRTDGIGNASSYRYDLLGRLVERQLPGYAAGQISKQWTYQYDLAGRLSEWRDGNGTRVRQIYDAAEKRLTERRVMQLPTNGVLLSTMATHETWAYDDFDRVVSAQTWWSTYPELSGTQPPSLVEAIDAYDGIGRQTLERFRYLAMVSKDLTYGYAKPGGEDASIRRSMSTSAGVQIGTKPDGAGKLVSMTLSGPSIALQPLADWRYEGNRPLRRSFLPGTAAGPELVTDYTYNALRHMTQMTTTRFVGGTGTGVYDLVMQRDVEGNVTQHRTAKASGAAGDWFKLDGWDRLQEVKLGVTSFTGTYDSATVYDKKITYAVDEAHNRSRVDEEAGGVSTYTQYTRNAGTNEYDEVTASNGDVQQWLYDGNGNLLSDGYFIYLYDHLDRLSAAYVLTYPGGATDQTASGTVVRVYGVEPQKRRAGKAAEVYLELWRYMVRRAQQRVSAARASAGVAASDPRVPLAVNAGTSGPSAAVVDEAVPVIVAYYGYDPSKRRVGKLLADFTGAFYAWSGWDLVEAYDMSFTPTTVWFEGGVIDEHLGYAWRNPTTGVWLRYGYVQDHLRGIAQVVDSAGVIVERYEYNPYGKMSAFTASGIPNGTVPTIIGQVYGFTGRQVDPETGLAYWRHRYYQPEHGRFLSQDPVGTWVDFINHGNAYAYCGSQPGWRSDPSGLWSPSAHDSLIYDTFKDELSPAAIKWLQEEGRKFDSKTQKELHKHSMRGTSESIDDALRNRNTSICEALDKAREAAKEKRINDAWVLLTGAMHIAMDGTSPAHVTPHGDPRPFWPCLVDYWPHIPGIGSEDPGDITPTVRDRTRKALLIMARTVFAGSETPDGKLPEPSLPSLPSPSSPPSPPSPPPAPDPYPRLRWSMGY